MSAITISQVLNARFRVSKQLDDLTHQMHTHLDLSSKGRVVRLAIGRSLGLGPFDESDGGGDSKGQEVPARAIFKDEDVEIWLGLILAHAKTTGQPAIDSLESLRTAIRAHWQRGISALEEDWHAADQSYEKFVMSLVSRRAHISGTVSSQKESAISTPTAKPLDASEQVARALREIGIDAEVRGEPIHGPRVTRYRVYLKDVNQIGQLERKQKEMSLLLNVQVGSPSIARGDEARVVFLSIPRARESWTPVLKASFADWVREKQGKNCDALPIFLGLNELGKPFEMSVVDAPHLFVAGTTGSGKSVCLHSIIASLISTQSPESIQLALIDPKKVEFSVYEGYAGLYRGDIAYEASDAVELLQELVVEMETRYSIFKQKGVASFHDAAQAGVLLPRIVVVVEELADLLLGRKDSDKPLTQLAQKARAAGIHLVLATQRPDAKTFTGLLRSNVPSRIALTVQKSSESTIILDETGAENLLGAGDMLVKANGLQVCRVHGVYLEREFLQQLVKVR